MPLPNPLTERAWSSHRCRMTPPLSPKGDSPRFMFSVKTLLKTVTEQGPGDPVVSKVIDLLK